MTTQFDASHSASALTGFSPFDPLELAQEALRFEAIEQAEAVASSRKMGQMVDWNVFHPDGSDKSITDLLQDIAQPLSAEIHLGRALASGSAIVLANSIYDPENYHPATPELKSSIVEASLAGPRFILASDKEVSSAVLENYRANERSQLVIGVALPDLRGPQEPAAGLVINMHAMPSQIDLPKYLAQLQQELSAWLQAWQACRDCQGVSSWKRWERWIQAQRKTMIATIVLGLLLALFIPMPYWPQRECTVEPSKRQFVSSPIDGRFLQSVVRPGDVVEAGQILGRLDDEQLRWELSSAQAELEQAGKQQDSALANQEGGRMRLAQLEQQKISLKIQSLQAQLERLELRAPIAGVVLQGEWYRSEGAPVARGDTLFEIAPLERMTVQVHLTTEDLGQIEIYDNATVRIDSAQGDSWQGPIERIDPRAAVINEEVCFVAEMEVSNRENRLRPGMKGSVRVDAGTRTIGWHVFHRPYTWLMKYLVW